MCIMYGVDAYGSCAFDFWDPADFASWNFATGVVRVNDDTLGMVHSFSTVLPPKPSRQKQGWTYYCGKGPSFRKPVWVFLFK